MARPLGVFIFAALITLAEGCLEAQVTTGTIVGVVQDPTGAAIPGARVTVMHQGMQERRQVGTNERGEFSVSFLRVGEFSVTVDAQGFQTQTQTGIEMQVDQTLKLLFVMKVGAISERVEVTSAAPLIDASTSSLGQVIGSQKILELPLNGRNAFALGLLSGNTVPMAGMGTNLAFVAGGGRFALNDVLLDGIDNNTSGNGSNLGRNGIAYTPSVDAVEEFKVKTSSFSAEFGRSAGAIISATTKSGTNEYHGSAWEFLRNEAFDANNFFSNAAKVARQSFKQNQFGFTLGGPTTIPAIYKGKDRTFFFADYEGFRRRTKASSSVADIPPTAFRSGDFSGYKPLIFDPRARRIGPSGSVVSTPLPGNVIPQSLLNPSAAAVMGLLPPPNFGDPGTQSRNYLRIAPRLIDRDQFDVKIDHRPGNSDTMFGRFSLGNSTTPQPGRFDGFIGGGTDAIRNTRNAVLGETHIFGTRTVNEVRFGFTRVNSSTVPRDTASGVSFAQKNQFAMFPYAVPQFPTLQFIFSGLNNGSRQFSDLGGGSPDLDIENTFHISDNISITHGNHTFKSGGDVRRYRIDNIMGNGILIFGSIFTSSSDTPGSGAPLADFLMGYPARSDGRQFLDWARQRDLYTGFYFQDDWRASSRLTVNIGIRFDLYTQPVDSRDRGGLFNAATSRIALPGKDGFSRAIVRGDHNNWAPRLGFAYSVTKRLTVRSGAGIFFARREQNAGITQIGSNIPNIPVVPFPSISATGTVAPPVTINSAIQLAPSDPYYRGITPANPVSNTTRGPDFLNSPAPYVAEWNFDLQYALQQNLVVEAAYSGSKGTKLMGRQNLNQIPLSAALSGRTTQADRPFPLINNNVNFDAGIANSMYNSLNLRLEKRYSAGVVFLLNYTWSKNLESNGNGDSSYDQNGGTTLPLDTYNLWRERSYAPLDVPHVFNFSYGYEMPLGAGKRWLNQKGVANWVLGGWQINGIATCRSGFPTDIRTSRVPSANQMFATLNVPDRLSGVPMYLPSPGVDGWFNSGAFTEPQSIRNAKGTPITMFGNAARRVARGPGSRNLDFSLFKNLRIRERVNVQFRAEAFNLTNTPTFFLPSANNASLTIGTANFGKLSSSSATGRQVQFGLKLAF